jgi:hypothetical protein
MNGGWVTTMVPSGQDFPSCFLRLMRGDDVIDISQRPLGYLVDGSRVRTVQRRVVDDVTCVAPIYQAGIVKAYHYCVVANRN